MPELPDVEVFKQYIDATSLHQRINHVHVPDTQILQDVTRQKLAAALDGSELDHARRHGKHLGVALSRGGWLILHFGMTGWASYFKDPADEPEHTKLRLDFDNGYHFAYVCVRKIGMVGLCDDFDAYIEAHELGPDLLGIGMDTFRERLDGRRGSIKTALMNQHVAAGLGNVYSDEILYQAGIDPRRAVNELSQNELETIYRKMNKVLDVTIERKADPEAVPRTWLLPHRERGAACPRCGAALQKVDIGGRRGYVCPNCQN